MKAMNSKQNRNFTIILLCMYGLILTWIVLLKASPVSELRYLPCERTLNLIPFHYDTEVGTHLEEVVLNVLVFVPLGLFLVMLGMKAWKAILIGLCLSFVFETLQFALAIGAADVTDLITNTAGTAIGACAYLPLRRVCKRTDRLNRTLNAILCSATVLFLILAAFLLIANR